MRGKEVEAESARRIWAVLVEECGADDDERHREDFVRCAVHVTWIEYRFCGSLGFGGKVWNNHGFYVSCYGEDNTPEREAAIRRANDRLAAIYAGAQ